MTQKKRGRKPSELKGAPMTAMKMYTETSEKVRVLTGLNGEYSRDFLKRLVDEEIRKEGLEEFFERRKKV